jgi:hypothetical protein
MFLRNVGSVKSHSISRTIRRHSSTYNLIEIKIRGECIYGVHTIYKKVIRCHSKNFPVHLFVSYSKIESKPRNVSIITPNVIAETARSVNTSSPNPF